jgi:hypothetical protein
VGYRGRHTGKVSGASVDLESVTDRQKHGSGNGSESRGQGLVHLGIGKLLDKRLDQDTVLSLSDKRASSSGDGLGSGQVERLGEEPSWAGESGRHLSMTWTYQTF